jgi:hypothetical protein
MHKLLGRKSDVEFKTSLSMSECQTRLMQELHRKRKMFGFRHPPPIVEKFNGTSFLISRNHSYFYRDNYLVLSGDLKSTSDGTFVRASFRLYGQTFAILVLGFVVFFGLAANDVISNGVEKGVLLIPIVFFAFIGLILWLTLWVNKSQRNGLASYLHSILTPISENVNSKES